MRTVLLLLLIAFVLGQPPSVAVLGKFSETQQTLWDDKCENYLNANVGNNNGTLEIGSGRFKSSCTKWSHDYDSNHTIVQLTATCYDISGKLKESTLRIGNPISDKWRQCVEVKPSLA